MSMNKYRVLFQGDDVLLHIEAENAHKARIVFNKQLRFEKLKEKGG